MALFQSQFLVVDDNEDNRYTLARRLRREGYENLDMAEDGEQALDLMRKNEYDMVLLDIMMPRMDGFEVLRQMKSDIRLGAIPVVVISALEDIDSVVVCIELGAEDYLPKPFNPVLLRARIHTCLEKRRLRILEQAYLQELEIRVGERTEELRQTKFEIIRRLGRAGEYRDNETSQHVVRMSKSCQVIAQTYGLSDDECETILHASPMHDIGKIGIPDTILLKPARLTADEMVIMKTHAEIGADIIGEHASDILHMARIIAMTHHERWDGAGYPKGLSGDNIPAVGRIAAVSDVFDALTSERPYKKAWEIEDAVSHINGEKAKHFCPDVIDIFNELLPAILQIREDHKDQEENILA